MIVKGMSGIWGSAFALKGDPAGSSTSANCRRVLLFGSNGSIAECAEHRAHHRCQPEKPELRNRPATHEERHTCAACRIHGCVCDGDADEVNQRQGKADGNRCKASRSALIRRAENHQQEEHGHDHFCHECGEQRIPARPLDAKPFAISNPAAPLAITYSTAPAAIAPHTCETM